MNAQQAADVGILQQFRLDGRVALLSGAAGHLGRAMAEALAGAGAHVVLNGRSCEKLEAFSAELQGRGYAVSTACFDITDEPAVVKNMALIGQAHGRLDILVNNASSGRTGNIESTTVADFEQLYRVNVVAAFRLMQVAVPLLKASAKTHAGASVVNIASMYGKVSPDPSIYGALTGTSGAQNPPSYGAAKAALIQMTRYAACHLAPDGIRVNSISPGPFPAARYLQNDPEFQGRLNAKVPMRRTGDPRELQGPLLFLASDASSYVTGIDLPVDGGWTAW
jgi:NAD(P)-dependent dehydrogenase (short-subunit alcohol dehydrogenase family)